EVQLGQKATLYYDPRGQVIRTVNPDGSEQRVIYGIPDDLRTPERFTPTPWEAYTYDANDNAARTHLGQGVVPQDHYDTPSSIVIDALGRTVRAVERLAREELDSDGVAQWYSTVSTYDVRGNLITVVDALGRKACTY